MAFRTYQNDVVRVTLANRDTFISPRGCLCKRSSDCAVCHQKKDFLAKILPFSKMLFLSKGQISLKHCSSCQNLNSGATSQNSGRSVDPYVRVLEESGLRNRERMRSPRFLSVLFQKRALFVPLLVIGDLSHASFLPMTRAVVSGSTFGNVVMIL